MAPWLHTSNLNSASVFNVYYIVVLSIIPNLEQIIPEPNYVGYKRNPSNSDKLRLHRWCLLGGRLNCLLFYPLHCIPKSFRYGGLLPWTKLNKLLHFHEYRGDEKVEKRNGRHFILIMISVPSPKRGGSIFQSIKRSDLCVWKPLRLLERKKDKKARKKPVALLSPSARCILWTHA